MAGRPVIHQVKPSSHRFVVGPSLRPVGGGVLHQYRWNATGTAATKPDGTATPATEDQANATTIAAVAVDPLASEVTTEPPPVQEPPFQWTFPFILTVAAGLGLTGLLAYCFVKTEYSVHGTEIMMAEYVRR